jgi:hypothetical protein
MVEISAHRINRRHRRCNSAEHRCILPESNGRRRKKEFAPTRSTDAIVGVIQQSVDAFYQRAMEEEGRRDLHPPDQPMQASVHIIGAIGTITASWWIQMCSVIGSTDAPL